jgi:hypothetical protein
MCGALGAAIRNLQLHGDGRRIVSDSELGIRANAVWPIRLEEEILRVQICMLRVVLE